MEIFARISSGGDFVNLAQFTDFLKNTVPGCDDDQEFRQRAELLFKTYSNSSGMSKSDFSSLWNAMLEKCYRPRSALVVVDYQNDFISGTLSLRQCPLGNDPDTLLPRLNELIELFGEVVYSFDWHPENHISFIESRFSRKLHESNQNDLKNVQVGDELIFDVDGRPVVQKMWPAHCLQGSEGAQLHRDLTVKKKSIQIFKGGNPDVDSYSAFWDNSRMGETELKKELLKRNITNLFVVGLAFDACVSFTALDAVKEGFTTCILEDVTQGISAALTSEANAKLDEACCPRISSTAVPNLLTEKPLPWMFLWQQARLLVKPN